MSLWRVTQRLPEVRALYGPHFPLEIRHYFADWIEAQPWQAVAEENNADRAAALTQSLIGAVKERLDEQRANTQSDTFILQTQLSQALSTFETTYALDPLTLAQFLAKAMQFEQQHAQYSSADGSEFEDVKDPTTTIINHGFSSVVRDVVQQAQVAHQTVTADMPQLEQRQETFLIKYHGFVQVENEFKSLQQQAATSNDPQLKQYLASMVQQKQSTQQQLTDEAQQLLEARQALHSTIARAADTIQSGADGLIQQLERWRAAQRQHTATQQHLTLALDTIQQWADSLMTQVWQIRQVTKLMCNLQVRLPLNPQSEKQFDTILHAINKTLALLLHRSLVVEQQPPQVLKTQSRFQATVRLLVGPSLTLHLNPPEVSAHIVNERNVREIRQTTLLQEGGQSMQLPLPDPPSSGDILNSRKAMGVQPGNNALQVGFKTLSLRKIKRTDKSEKIDHTVTEQKFSICFRVTVTLPGGDSVYLLQELSLPVVVVVHGNQVPGAEATVLWDNAFALPGRLGLETEQAVQWQQLAPHIKQFWMNAKLKPLKDEHMNFLAQLAGVSGPHDTITWHRFNKDYMVGNLFTFWEWFYGCFDTVRKHIRALWDEDLVYGFIDKDETFRVLAGSRPGTFLVRFSTSLVSGVSVSWVGPSPDGMQVYHLQPWMNKDISIRSLADRVSDLDQLQILYPDRPKHVAFAHHYSGEAKNSKLLTKGYIPADLKAFINPTDVSNEPMYQPRSDISHQPQTSSSLSSSLAPPQQPLVSQEPNSPFSSEADAIDLSWLTNTTLAPSTSTAPPTTTSVPSLPQTSVANAGLPNFHDMYLSDQSLMFDAPALGALSLYTSAATSMRQQDDGEMATKHPNTGGYGSSAHTSTL
ncbi:STAT5A/MGF protein [Salpingoeca rosetta]|uniref:Signal transducer and activator of transcription n=1 Tax=Salpingoeca rosetta (strain ATCC 50818 / BSB-021) TaxID=946362 RepID=F2U6J4_SALR5|nr:STAT5A/MGF protein [Salpingoeca rosetta]EGD83476.1 STAT5A/MGF protein [Salpingoeca rosetta]|eukprot:XP_004994980.1 STAT5A/MGF protein [Salpingoeca rosetta]